MSYQDIALITQIAALLLFIALFVVVLLYAFWPSNRALFERAAKTPLDAEPEPPTTDGRS